MKKIISLVLALCLMLSVASCALAAYDATKPACQTPGHEKFDGTDHDRPKPCWTKGHFNCDGMDHSRAACGVWKHFNCDGREHPAAECGIEGHYACKGDHGQARCGVEGHKACEDGHTALVNDYCNAEPKHTRCQKNEEHICDPENGGCGATYACKDSKEHTTCKMCGLLVCDDSLGAHYAPCGNNNHRQCYYNLQGKVWRSSDHPKCHLCGGGKCSGSHGEGVCVAVCGQCWKPLINDSTHRTKCGVHYSCITKGLNHDWCSKHNMPKCLDSHPKH